MPAARTQPTTGRRTADYLTNPARPPKVGSFGSAAWLANEGRWRVTLTAEGRQFLEEWCRKWPVPSVLVARRFPDIYARGLALGLTRDDIDALCRLGVTEGLTRYTPREGGSFTAIAVWYMSAQVKYAVRYLGRRKATGELAEGRPEDDEVDERVSLHPARPDERGNPDRRDQIDRIRRDVAEVLTARIKRFRDREIFALFYGLRDGRQPSKVELAAVFDVSDATIWLVIKQVTERIKPDLADLLHDWHADGTLEWHPSALSSGAGETDTAKVQRNRTPRHSDRR